MGRVACLAHFLKNAVDSVGESLMYQKRNRCVGLGEGNANRCR